VLTHAGQTAGRPSASAVRDHTESAETHDGPGDRRSVRPDASPIASRPRSGQVVLVSDRGPVRFRFRGPDTLDPEPQSSAVTATLRRVAARTECPISWVTQSTSAADAYAMHHGLYDALGLGYSMQVVPISEADFRGYYFDGGIDVIWPVLCDLDDIPVRFDTKHPLTSLAPYHRVNKRLAARAAQVAAPGAVVAVQDYQLMLAPAAIRAARPDLAIIHFLHTPFPTVTSLARLPTVIVSTLVDGMLGADLLGFQSPRWARRFLACCQWLGHDVNEEHGYIHCPGRRVWVRCYPVAVDCAALTRQMQSPAVRRWTAATVACDRARRIVRVDRMDPAKNTVRGFQAYARLLNQHPDLAREVRFIACLVPTVREQAAAYRRFAAQVWRVVAEINRQHPGAITVHYGNDKDRALAVLGGYDVLLVNAGADGQNLVALEGPIVNAQDGAMVLSRTVGAADVLGVGALILDDPRDIDLTARALHTALTMPADERRTRARLMRRAVENLDAGGWLDRQLADVAAVRHGGAPSTSPP